MREREMNPKLSFNERFANIQKLICVPLWSAPPPMASSPRLALWLQRNQCMDGSDPLRRRHGGELPPPCGVVVPFGKHASTRRYF